MTALVARILLRVIAGAFIGQGWTDVADAFTSDPDVLTALTQGVDAVVGAAIWGGAELWYLAAKKFGWRT